MSIVWSDTKTPILDLHTNLGQDPSDSIAISYFNATGIWNTRHVKLKYADTFAASLDQDKNNVYVMVNDVKSSVPLQNVRGSVSHITKLKALWADLDVKDSGLADFDTAFKAIAMLTGMLNSEPTAIVMSGYGLQPYWHIDDGDVTDNNRVYMSGLVKRWGSLVQHVASIYGGHVDPVYDLPRVLRAPGSTNYKDPSNPTKTKITFPNNSRPVTIAHIEEILTGYGFSATDTPMDEFVVVSSPEDWEPAENDCTWATSLVDEITTANPKARHPWLVGKAVKIQSAARNGCITGETYEELVLLLRDKFVSLLGEGTNSRQLTPREVESAFTWARVLVSTFDSQRMAQAVSYHTHRLGELRSVQNLPKESPSEGDISAPGLESKTLGQLEPTVVLQEVQFQEESFAFTDSANATRLATQILGKYLYVPNVGWHLWENTRYVPDERKKIVQEAIDACYAFAAQNPIEPVLKWAKRSLQAGPIKAAIELAQSEPEIVCAARELDAASRELCTPKGIVDLTTGLLRPADPFKDRHTKQTIVPPSTTPTPMWDNFLETIIQDKDRIDYIQEIFGLAIIGESLHHILPLFVGTGANGKSTILEVASGILGDYVVQMPENFLLDKGHQEHSTEIARLRGARLAIGSETRPDGRFNESRVKMLTGGDTISARLIGKNFFDFKPTHTLVLAMNHLPKVTAGGEGFWRRVRKINFGVTIPPEQQDKELAQKLIAQEGQGILQWMIEGAKRVLENGQLNEPESVVIATKEYQLEEDHIAQFIEDRVMVNPYMGSSATEIFNNYKAWCTKESEQPLSRTQLIRELMHRLPIVKDKNKKGNVITGIGLYEDI